MSDERERIYDEEIKPLMGRIIELCKAHKIPMLATFHIVDAADGTPDGKEAVMCSTVLAPLGATPRCFDAAWACIAGPPRREKAGAR